MGKIALLLMTSLLFGCCPCRPVIVEIHPPSNDWGMGILPIWPEIEEPDSNEFEPWQDPLIDSFPGWIFHPKIDSLYDPNTKDTATWEFITPEVLDSLFYIPYEDIHDPEEF